MKLKDLLYIACVIIFLVPGIVCSQSVNQSGKRFLGFHFDFHATKDDKDIGKELDTEAIELFLSNVKPDFIQVDTKGVHGISSYPTKVGFTSTDYQSDVLRLWRNFTDKYDVDLYSHYTTIMDEEAVARFPEWARMNGDNKKDNAKVSIFSNYVNDLFLPQVEEFISDYDLDGIWIDADSWAFEPEYGSNVRNKLRSKTNLTDIPSGDNSGYNEYLEFMRNEYTSYAKDYVKRIHAIDPNFKVGINWAYSKMMPEPVAIDVDYLSADMSGKNWVYDAAFDARVFASYDKPWDLMSWSFYDKGIKPEKLLLLEAAEVISMGGGYLSYWFQKRNGGFDKSNLNLMNKIADFCRAREPYCFESKIIPQVGVFFSRETWAKNTKSIYNGGGNDNIQGITSLLLDAGASVQIIMEHQVNELSSYPFIVIPEADGISPDIKNKFVNYVNNGGKLLIIGKDAVKNFKSELNVDLIESFDYKSYSLKNNNSIHSFDLPYIEVKANNNTDILVNSYQSENSSKILSPFITSKKLGSGSISGLYSDLGEFYFKNESGFLAEVFKKILDDIYPNRIISEISDNKIHFTLTEKNEQKLIQMVNVQNLKPNMDAESYNSITPSKNVKLKIRLANKPSRIVMQPENEELIFGYSNGVVEITIPNIYIYSILQVVN